MVVSCNLISLPYPSILLLEGCARAAPDAPQSRPWRAQAFVRSVYDPRRPTLAHSCMVSTLSRSSTRQSCVPERYTRIRGPYGGHAYRHSDTALATRSRVRMAPPMAAPADTAVSRAHLHLYMTHLHPARASGGGARRRHPYTFSRSQMLDSGRPQSV